MTSKKVWAVGVVALAAFFFLAPSIQGQTGSRAAVTANQRARVSVPVDWSTDYVVAPMIQWGGVRILPTNEPRVLHRRLLAQPRAADGRLVSAMVSGSLYFENGSSAASNSVEDSLGGEEPTAKGKGQWQALSRLRRRFQRRSFITDWSFGPVAGPVVGSPAKFNFDVTTAPSCTADILYVPVNVAGSSVQANLVALNNLYTNPGGTGACAGTAPTIVWTMGFTGTIQTSPVLSLDGSILFVVESLVSGAVVHAIQTGSVTCSGACTLTNAATPSTPTNRLWSATLSGSANDSISSPFIKYTFTSLDELFVGDDAGLVHRFTNILAGSGAEVVDGTWPVTVSSGVQLSSPTVDASTGILFVGAANGFLHRVTISTGVVTTSAVVGGPLSFGGIVDAPVIDVTNQRVLVTTGNTGSGSTGFSALAQFAETFASGASPTAKRNFGAGGVANAHRPAFDDGFLTSGSGNTYVGAPSFDASDTVIVRFTYSNASGLGSTFTSVSLTNTGTSAAVETSPVTVFRNATTATEFAYISGLGGLVTNEQRINRINTATFLSVANSSAQAGGTSPIVVDNIGAASEQSNIYFGTRSNVVANFVVKLLQQF